MKKILCAVLLLFFIFKLNAQNTIGIPDIINYSKDVYSAGTQNRGIVQDKNGIMYFANQEGLLSFDGTYWKTYALPNKSIVRSLAIGKDNKIYVGGQDDFGYFTPDKSGKLVFTSIKTFLSKKDFECTDLWNTIVFGDNIFFRSKEKIYQWDGNTIYVYPSSKSWEYLGVGNNKLIAQDGDRLLQFNNSLWQPFASDFKLSSKFIISTILHVGNDSSLLITINTGFYILSNNHITDFHFKGLNPFVNQRILTATCISKGKIAVGTNLAGFYVIDKNGDVIQNISRKEGLQLNNILYLYEDQRKNLWIGLDNGIDFIAYNNAIKHIYPEKLNEGEGYTALIFKNNLYVGTSNGLYSVALSDKKDLSFCNGDFTPIADTKGSTFALFNVNDNLLLGHHDGAYKVNGNSVTPLDVHSSFFNFIPYYSIQPSSLIIAGSANGLSFFNYKNNAFSLKSILPNFNEYAQYLAIDNNNILWDAHPYRGVYRIDISDSLNPKIKLYTQANGLPSSLNNHLFKIKNRIVVTTEKGLYEYDATKDNFKPSSLYASFFTNKNVRNLKEDQKGNIWFIEDKNLGVLDFSKGKPAVIYFPELNDKMVKGFEYIYPYDENNIFVGAEKGFYHINYTEYKLNHYSTEVRISTVKALGKTDTLLFGGYGSDINAVTNKNAAAPDLSNKLNSLHFEYSAPFYENQKSLEYCYRLKGFDNGWSEWSKRAEKDYTNLQEGNYIFQVKAKNNLNGESAISAYSFTVLPPWYRTITAYIIYFLIAGFLIYKTYKTQQAMLHRQQKKHEEEQQRLQYLHQLEMDKSEKEIIKLQNEKLEAELTYKNSELASTSMHLMQKGDLLENIKDELIRIKKSSADDSNNNVKKLIRVLKEETKLDKDWEQFALHFDAVHAGFIKMLKQKYPAISAHDLKLCAYLRMNLSSKEIAQLENISVRGVEISRYRLRKKLQIPTETNLFDFLLQVSYDD